MTKFQSSARSFLCLGLSVAIVGISPEADAAPRTSDNGREGGNDAARDDPDDDDDDDDVDDDIDGAEDTHLRIHIDSEALGGAWTSADGDPEGDGNDNGNSVSFGAGVARSSLLDSGPAVFSRPLIGVGLGYVFADDRAILGAKLGLSVDGFAIDSSARTVAIGGRLVPYFQWMFRPDRWLRPYAEARLGFGGTAASQDVEVVGRTTGHVVYPTLGAGGGVHFFAREWFSLDVGFNVDYAAPFTRTTFEDDDLEDTDFDKAADVVNFGVLLGMSVWFGDYHRGRVRSRSNNR